MDEYDDFDEQEVKDDGPVPEEKDYTLCFVRRTFEDVDQILLGMKKRGFGAGQTAANYVLIPMLTCDQIIAQANGMGSVGRWRQGNHSKLLQSENCTKKQVCWLVQ